MTIAKSKAIASKRGKERQLSGKENRQKSNAKMKQRRLRVKNLKIIEKLSQYWTFNNVPKLFRFFGALTLF